MSPDGSMLAVLRGHTRRAVVKPRRALSIRRLIFPGTAAVLAQPSVLISVGVKVSSANSIEAEE